jgi:hypothetical protein
VAGRVAAVRSDVTLWAEARMDTARWNDRDDEFAVLDLIARFRFKTACSVSFELGTKGDTLDLPGRRNRRRLVVAPGRVFSIIGWLDAHHPCEGYHRLQLRVGLPDPYVCWESMRDLVPQVKAALGLPADESYRVCLTELTRQTAMEDPQSGCVS